jgi:hypothetical protein
MKTYNEQYKAKLAEIELNEKNMSDTNDGKHFAIINQRYEEAAGLRDTQKTYIQKLELLYIELAEIEKHIVDNKEEGWAKIHGKSFGI